MKKTIKKISCAVLVGSCLVLPVGCSQQSADNSKQETENQVQVATGVETTSEYAKVSAPSQTGSTGMIQSDANIQQEVNFSKSNAITEDQAFLFDLIINQEGQSKDEILSGKVTVEAADELQGYTIEAFIQTGDLPSNGLELFNIYKQQNNYYDQFTEANHEKPEVIQKAEYEAPATSTSSSKAPQATTKQQVQQVQNNTPSNDDLGAPTVAQVIADHEAAGHRVVSEEEYYASDVAGCSIRCSDGVVYVLPGK